MEKTTQTRKTVIGCLINVSNSIIQASKTLLGNDDINNENEIKDIEDYKPGELSIDDEELIQKLKDEERKLKGKLKHSHTSIEKQLNTVERTKNAKVKITEKEKE